MSNAGEPPVYELCANVIKNAIDKYKASSDEKRKAFNAFKQAFENLESFNLEQPYPYKNFLTLRLMIKGELLWLSVNYPNEKEEVFFNPLTQLIKEFKQPSGYKIHNRVLQIQCGTELHKAFIRSFQIVSEMLKDSKSIEEKCRKCGVCRPNFKLIDSPDSKLDQGYLYCPWCHYKK